MTNPTKLAFFAISLVAVTCIIVYRARTPAPAPLNPLESIFLKRLGDVIDDLTNRLLVVSYNTLKRDITFASYSNVQVKLADSADVVNARFSNATAIMVLYFPSVDAASVERDIRSAMLNTGITNFTFRLR